MTVLKLGYTNPLTDAFGAHPTLGAALDLNDGQTFTLVSPEGLELAPPPRTLVQAGNIRTQGERATKAIYRHNREAVCHLILGPGSSYASFVASVRQLLLWLNAPPSVPVTLQWQPPSASAPVYLDVVGCAHELSTDEDQWLRLQLEPISIVFVVRPGLRGDRVTLSNLLVNPGMGQGSGPGVKVFDDSFANVNAYAVVSGGNPSVAANVMTIANGSVLTFGSPNWGAVNTWTVRFQFATGLTGIFLVHYTNGSNDLHVSISGTQLVIKQKIAGVGQTVGTAQTIALTNGTWYWLQVTQFPTSPSTSVNGNPPDIQATLFNDNAGALGAQIAQVAAAPAFDSVTSLSGVMGFNPQGAAMNIGGAFAGVHTVTLFGPGGWTFNGGSGTGVASGAWEQSTANTLPIPQSPVTSFGALRVDLPPAGTVIAVWNNGDLSSAGSIQQTGVSVFAPGNTLQIATWLKAQAVSVSCSFYFQVNEYDSTGAFLRQTQHTMATGAVASWTQYTWSLTTGANCAYVVVGLGVQDTVAGASANDTVWWDNAQVWNQSTTGVAAGGMPYCELRFSQSPAQLLVSGLLGDLPTPAQLALGTFLANWAKGSTLGYAIGRRGSYAASFQGAAPSIGVFNTMFSPQATPVLDATSYGGYYVKATVNNSTGWNPRAFSPKATDALGVYHLLTRYRTQDATPAGVQVRVRTEENLDPWYAAVATLRSIGTYWGPYVSPLAAGNVWTVCDAGQAALPPFARGALRDDSQMYEIPRPEWVGTTGGGAEGDSSWMALLPVDGSLLAGIVNNPANNGIAAVTNQWLWSYFDGLLTSRAAAGDGPGWTYSLEGLVALASPGHGGGGAGTQGTGNINVNSAADPSLTLDPSLVGGAGQSGGINQMVGYIADSAGAVLPLHAEIQYSPLYLWPR
jgi:hypothetical protein